MRALELRAAIAARTGSLREALEILLTAAELAPRPDDAAVLLADAVHATYYLADARRHPSWPIDWQSFRPH